jgi:hypothetical protein
VSDLGLSVVQQISFEDPNQFKQVVNLSAFCKGEDIDHLLNIFRLIIYEPKDEIEDLKTTLILWYRKITQKMNAMAFSYVS